MNENNALKKLAKMPSEDEMAREVAKRELALAAEEKIQRPKFSIRNKLLQKRRFTLKKAGMMK